jgi:mannosidase alpha-like ER degradation enhancer 2
MKRKNLLLIIVVFAFLLQCTSDGRNNLANQVKDEFLHSWKGYKEYAWGHDALQPLSKSYHDWYSSSLFMTPIDAFDTMILMGLDQQAAEAKKIVLENLSFDHDMYVKNFEINIRLMGGLLSAYQLDGDKRFLKLAKDLGERLLPAFDSPTGMPYMFVNLKTGETKGKINNPAEIGTQMLEFGTLSKLTGRPVFYNTAKKAVESLFNKRSDIGLVGTTINVETGEWVNEDSHLSGMIDSYYEYLLKSWLLFGDKDFKEMWGKSIVAINQYLADRSYDGLWYGRTNMRTGKRTATTFGALDAFFPGVLALSGDLKRAAELQKSCFEMWQLHGIEPEVLDYSKMEVVSEGYPLRPENIESAYYLYKFTGNKKYLDMGKTFFKSLKKYCRTEVGYAHLKSIITKEKSDAMESFFLAETLKYLYLLLSPDEIIDLDKIVFNTEAHPLQNTWD